MPFRAKSSFEHPYSWILDHRVPIHVKGEWMDAMWMVLCQMVAPEARHGRRVGSTVQQPPSMTTVGGWGKLNRMENVVL